jgi:hypothetical protein
MNGPERVDRRTGQVMPSARSSMCRRGSTRFNRNPCVAVEPGPLVSGRARRRSAAPARVGVRMHSPWAGRD